VYSDELNKSKEKLIKINFKDINRGNGLTFYLGNRFNNERLNSPSYKPYRLFG